MKAAFDVENNFESNCSSYELGEVVLGTRDEDGFWDDTYTTWKDVPINKRTEALNALKSLSKHTLRGYKGHNIVVTDIKDGLIYKMATNNKGWNLVKKWKNKNTTNINYMWTN